MHETQEGTNSSKEEEYNKVSCEETVWAEEGDVTDPSSSLWVIHVFRPFLTVNEDIL